MDYIKPYYVKNIKQSLGHSPQGHRDWCAGAMKTIRIHLHPVEEAMLIEVQKVNRRFRDIETLLLGQIREEYAKTPKGRSGGSL